MIKPEIHILEFDNDSSKIDFKRTSSCPRIGIDRYGQQLRSGGQQLRSGDCGVTVDAEDAGSWSGQEILHLRIRIFR